MDFSETYKSSTDPAPCYSPDGQFIATAVEYRLIIREAESLRVVQLYSCLDRISELSWAPSSLYVMCAIHARGIVQVFSTDQPDWACKIDEGPAGVSHVMWAPDGLSVIILADYQIRTTVWSLMDRKCTYLRGTKYKNKGCVFSPDNTTLAVLERYDCKDHVTLYSTQGWQQTAHVTLDTQDAVDLAWAPDGQHLAVWDSCLTYQVCVLNALGHPVCTYSAYQDSLGVKGVSWSPSGDLLALGSYDQALRLLNQVTWQPLLQADHPATVSEPEHVVVYREVAENAPAASPSGRRMTPTKSPAKPIRVHSQYMVDTLPARIPSQTPSFEEYMPRIGVGLVSWSPDSQFLVTRNDNMPSTLWVWDMATMELSAVLCHMADILDVQWAPQGCTLAAVAGTDKVYLWTPAGSSIVHVPHKDFNARKVYWNPRGSSLCLTDREAFCCAYIARD